AIVWSDLPDRLFSVQLHQIVVGPIFADVACNNAQRFEEIGWRLDAFGWGGGEIHFDPIATANGGKQAAAGMKASWLRSRELAAFAEHMGAGERRMAAEVDLHRRSKPAQRESVWARAQKSGFREIHLACHPLHPARIPFFGKHADRRRISREWH